MTRIIISATACFLCTFGFSAQLTTSALISTNQKCATLILAFPPPPLSCDSVNDSSLKGYWRLDEPSGDALDTKGSNTLTDNNGVTTQTGVIGSSREFTAASNQRLTRTDSADLSSMVTVWFWCRFGGTLDAGLNPGIISKWPGVGQNEFTVFMSGDDQRMEFTASGDGTTTATVKADNFGAVPTSMWLFGVAWVDSGASTINIQVGTLGSDNLSAVNSAAFSGSVFNGTGDFTIGSIGAGFTWTGQIDEVGFSKRILSATERLALFGRGMPCRPAGL